MARLLNQGVLPPGYCAVPQVNQDRPVEIDVATFQESSPDLTVARAPRWSPEAPSLVATIDPPAIDDVRVDVMTDDGDPRLVAAIELVSPRNKDRPSARMTFAGKCSGYLQHGHGLVVVDAVTSRRADLHAMIMEALGASETSGAPGGTAAISYRAAAGRDTAEVQVWFAPLAVGKPLPTVRLWIEGDLPVPLDLEVSHSAACQDLAIRPAG